MLRRLLGTFVLVASAASVIDLGPDLRAQPNGAVDPTDIVYKLEPADLSTYRYSTLACLGANHYWWEWGGSKGRYLTTTLFPMRDDTGALRAGVVSDPDDASRLAFQLSVMPSDEDTSSVGAKRCEIAIGWKEYRYPGKVPVRTVELPRNRDFWWTIQVRLADWRTTHDRQVIFQWLNAEPTVPNPEMAMEVWGDKLRLEIHHDFGAAPSEPTMTKLIPWTLNGWESNRWYKVVIRARIDTVSPSNGKLAMWIDGKRALDYRGPIGFTASAGDYAKFGLYHWTNNNSWDPSVVRRTAWYRGPALVLDRPGYDAIKIGALID